jgi:dihydrofolate reductase
LLKHDLLDEFRLWFFPVLLGTGKRLFGEGTVPAGLKLIETQTSSSGAVLQVHEAAGRPRYGSFEVAQPGAAEMER